MPPPRGVASACVCQVRCADQPFAWSPKSTNEFLKDLGSIWREGILRFTIQEDDSLYTLDPQQEEEEEVCTGSFVASFAYLQCRSPGLVETVFFSTFFFLKGKKIKN